MSGEAKWVAIQTTTFVAWMNVVLARKNVTVSSLADLCDGVVLWQLLEALSGSETSIKGVNTKPKMRIQKLENVALALKRAREIGINLVGIAAEDVLDGNAKILLGLVWTLVLRFHVSRDLDENSSAKADVLAWVNRCLTAQGAANVTNFTTDWSNGVALQALLEYQLSGSGGRSTTTIASTSGDLDISVFDIRAHHQQQQQQPHLLHAAETTVSLQGALDIAKQAGLAVVIDGSFAQCPDELSMMTQLALIRHNVN